MLSSPSVNKLLYCDLPYLERLYWVRVNDLYLRSCGSAVWLRGVLVMLCHLVLGWRLLTWCMRWSE